MDIAFYIPEWALWLVGIPAGLVLLFFAAFGMYWWRALKDWTPY